jgi:hypothetical protein
MSRTTIIFAVFVVPLLAAGCDRGSDTEATSVPTIANQLGDPNAVPEGSAPAAEIPEEGSAEAAVEEIEPEVHAIRVEPPGVRIAPGRPPVVLSATVFDAERLAVDVPVVWHNLDPTRVAITEAGELTALGPLGPAMVTVSAGEFVAEPIPIYVVDPADLPPPADGSGDGEAPETDPDRLELMQRLDGTWEATYSGEGEGVPVVEQLTMRADGRFLRRRTQDRRTVETRGTYRVVAFEADLVHVRLVSGTGAHRAEETTTYRFDSATRMLQLSSASTRVFRRLE